jgi:hypothetical protein
MNVHIPPITDYLESAHLPTRVAARWERRAGRPTKKFAEGKLVVSLTSYPARFATLALTLKCLLSQSLVPDEVILWIAENDREALPEAVSTLSGDGLSIRFCADIKSYKKIVPALEREPEAFIVTADDDVYYPETWLEELVAHHVPGERAVICHRAHEVRHFASGRPLPYVLWRLNTDTTEGPHLFFIGCGGVFYPPGSLPPETTEEDLFMRLCPTGDDIWLNWMARRSDARVRKVPGRHRIRNWRGSQRTALLYENVVGGANERQLRAMIEAFGYPPAPLSAV